MNKWSEEEISFYARQYAEAWIIEDKRDDDFDAEFDYFEEAVNWVKGMSKKNKSEMILDILADEVKNMSGRELRIYKEISDFEKFYDKEV